MKHNKHSQGQIQNPANVPQPAAAHRLTSAEFNFTPTPDEVARRAYFTYVNEGSRDGHEVQHWLQAEAELIAERNLTRVHGFHNQT
jgi:hypothetical protein